MSTDEGGLSRREHDQMRDLVLAGAQRIRPERTHRMEFAAAGVALLLVGAVAGGVITAAIRQGDQAKPVSTGDSRPAVGSNGWVTFGMGSPDSDIHVVGEGSPARRIVGSDGDGLDQVCPAFAPDGSRLAFGEATGTYEDGYGRAGLVIADVTADGQPSGARTVYLDDLTRPPCPVWSPDGRWLAFGAETARRAQVPTSIQQVWLVDTRSDSIRRLTGLSATDIEWAPDSSELFIASNGVLAYSPKSGQTRRVGDMPDAVALAVSPLDGSIAVEQTLGEFAPSQLWLMNSDGSDPRLLVEVYSEMHGIGPMWSPDGSRLVFQRTCSGWVDGTARSHGCREEHEAVVITVTDGDPLGPPGTQTVIVPPYTTDGSAPGTWFPWSVTWSPDGTDLLYMAWQMVDGQPGPAMESDGERIGLVAVSVDGSEPPATLYEGVDLGVYSGYPWNTVQSWQSR